MKKLIFVFLFVCTGASAEFEISTPDPQPQERIFELSDPDEAVAKLGIVSFMIDFNATQDDLLTLEVRRQDLRLADGRLITQFAISEKDEIIVGAVAPVSHVSIMGVETQSGVRVVQVIFYDDQQHIISPRAEDIGVYDLTYAALQTDYAPLKSASAIDVSVALLLDNSGSMSAFQSAAINSSKDFAAGLPSFTKCEIFTFASDVSPLVPGNKEVACADTESAFDKVSPASGATALMNALEKGFARTGKPLGTDPFELPKLVIVVTDGINTVTPSLPRDQLVGLKRRNNITTLVYWVGHHDKDHLQNLADQEIVGRANAKQDLEAFFETIGTTVAGVQSIKLI